MRGLILPRIKLKKMKVEVLNTFGKQKVGDVIEISESLAFQLIKKGFLKESKKRIPVEPKKSTQSELGKITEKNIQKK